AAAAPSHDLGVRRRDGDVVDVGLRLRAAEHERRAADLEHLDEPAGTRIERPVVELLCRPGAPLDAPRRRPGHAESAVWRYGSHADGTVPATTVIHVSSRGTAGRRRSAIGVSDSKR